MTTFEEDVIECYYNSLGYLTLKNHTYKAYKTRPGGKGRGEIDLLAVKVNKNSKIQDVVVYEIKFSITNPYPWADPADLLITKFIKQDIEEAIKSIIGENCQFLFYFATGIFNRNTRKNLVTNLDREIKGRYSLQDINDPKRPYEKYKLKITAKNYENEEKEVEIIIIEFQDMLRFILKYFKEKGLHQRNYTDSRFRSIAHYADLFEKK